MAPAAEQVLMDAANLSILVLGVGLLAGRLARQVPGWLPAALPGRVSVAPFHRVELGLAVGLVFLFYLVVRHPAALAPLGNSVYLAVMIGSYLLARRVDMAEAFGLRDLSARRIAWQSSLAFVVITAVTLAIHVGWSHWLTALVGKPDSQDRIRELRENSDLGFRLLLGFSACVLAPLSEEVLFRGFLYPALKRPLQPVLAAVVVAGIFAAIHLNLAALLPLFVLGLLLTLAYEWSGSLLVPVIVHSAFNLTNIVITVASPPVHAG
jgi:membrane protease YdiL (CAAX protease family)